MSKLTLAQAKKKVAKQTTAYKNTTIKSLTVVESGTSRNMLARWQAKAGKKDLGNIDHFDVDWEYYNEYSKRWVQGNNGTKSVSPSSAAGGFYQDAFTVPSDPTISQVRVRVKAVSKKRNVSVTYYKKKKKHTYKKEVAYWTDVYSGFKSYSFTTVNRPLTPAAPTAKLNATGNGITVTWGSFTWPTTCIVIHRYADNKIAPGKGVQVAPKDKSGLHVPAEVYQNSSGGMFTDLNIDAGHRYCYKAMAHNYRASGSLEWSPNDSQLISGQSTNWWFQNVLSDEVQTRPLDPTGQSSEFYGMTGDSKARIKVSWTDAGWAGDTYEVRYAETLDLLRTDGGYQTSSVSLNFGGDGTRQAHILEVDPGKLYFFRVVVKNSNPGNMGQSAFGNYTSCVAGTVPDSPTLASTEPFCKIGDEVQVSWTHNTTDTSEQSAAQIEIDKGGTTETVSISDSTASALIDTSELSDDTVVRWRVRTKGAHPDWSPWSAWSTFTVLAPPSCIINAAYPDGQGSTEALEPSGTIKMLPLTVALTAGGTAHQTPIEWTLEVVAYEDFTYTDAFGEDAIMRSGAIMMSVSVNASNSDFSATSQVINITSADGAFVNGARYILRGSVLTDAGLRSQDITFDFTCEWEYDLPEPSIDGLFDADTYTMAVIAGVYREVEPEEGSEETEPTTELVEDVTLDIYRINYDRTLTLIAEGLENAENLTITDPYPSFGTCMYRAVANDPHTDAMTAMDTIEIPTPVYGILIQWDDMHPTDFDEDTEAYMYSGEEVFLQWNIDVEEKAEPDRELVEYIGRENPVAYFGTQLGVTGSWSAELVKWEDAETLTQLRKLQRWQGTCYVRETSGAGYRAVVDVSFGRSYDSMKVPVTLDIKKVEDE